MRDQHGISFFELVMLVISSSIGAGIYNASQQLAAVASPGPALLAWLITGIGIFGLVLSLRDLSLSRPRLNGMSEYAQAGFGDFAGFISGWGYWLSSWLGTVAFATMMMSSIGYFLPSFRSGNSVGAVIVASLISWILTFIVMHGIESATFLNSIITVIKLIPLVAFILLGIVLFKANVFTAHFWVNVSTNFSYSHATAGGIFSQVKGCLITMMWIFVGIEGATMMGQRAKSKSDASRATVVGFLSLLFINVIISILPYGIMSQGQLAKLSDPALTYVVTDMIGPVGGALVSISLIITILGAWLSWTVLPVQATSQMASQKLLPKWFGKLNKHDSPAHSLILTQVMLQIFLISLLFTSQAYNIAISMCTAAIVVCYVLVGAFQVKVGIQSHSLKMIIPGIVAIIFETVGIFFAGLQFSWLCSIAYVLGFIFYIWAARQAHRKIPRFEWLLMALITIAAFGAIVALLIGKITLT